MRVTAKLKLKRPLRIHTRFSVKKLTICAKGVARVQAKIAWKSKQEDERGMMGIDRDVSILFLVTTLRGSNEVASSAKFP
jgi:hypothetical protein